MNSCLIIVFRIVELNLGQFGHCAYTSNVNVRTTLNEMIQLLHLEYIITAALLVSILSYFYQNWNVFLE